MGQLGRHNSLVAKDSTPHTVSASELGQEPFNQGGRMCSALVSMAKRGAIVLFFLSVVVEFGISSTKEESGEEMRLYDDKLKKCCILSILPLNLRFQLVRSPDFPPRASD